MSQWRDSHLKAKTYKKYKRFDGLFHPNWDRQQGYPFHILSLYQTPGNIPQMYNFTLNITFSFMQIIFLPFIFIQIFLWSFSYYSFQKNLLIFK